MLTHEGFLHLIRECDIFRGFSIYIPAENYVTNFSLYIRAVGARQKQAVMPVFVYIIHTHSYSIKHPPPSIELESNIVKENLLYRLSGKITDKYKSYNGDD